MKSIILSLALLSLTTAAYSVDTKLELLKSRELFNQKYELEFGQKPSDEIWQSNAEACSSGGSSNCRSCSGCKVET